MCEGEYAGIRRYTVFVPGENCDDNSSSGVLVEAGDFYCKFIVGDDAANAVRENGLGGLE